jgi:hypothetical protein
MLDLDSCRGVNQVRKRWSPSRINWNQLFIVSLADPGPSRCASGCPAEHASTLSPPHPQPLAGSFQRAIGQTLCETCPSGFSSSWEATFCYDLELTRRCGAGACGVSAA